MEKFHAAEITVLTPRLQQELMQLLTDAEFVPVNEVSDWLTAAVENSLLAAGVFNSGGELVGFGRVLGDGVSDCYIQDVTVRTDCRKQGLGRMLMDFLLDELALRGIDWVGLIATPGKADFYRNLGFEVLPGHTPMVLGKRRKTTTKAEG